MKQNFAGRTTKSQGEKILLLLIESGFLYCAFWVRRLSSSARRQALTVLQILQVVYYMDVSRDENRAIYLYIVVATMRDQLSVCPFNLRDSPSHSFE